MSNLQSRDMQVLSLFGKTLAIHHEPKGEWLARLGSARAAFESEKTEERAIQLARVYASGQRVKEAISVLSAGIEVSPSSYALYRYRGHRYISARFFDRAIADFERALELGLRASAVGDTPNESMMFNIWYHLGLAWYLKGDFGRAVQSYTECLRHCHTDEDVIACSDWLYMAYRRNGQNTEAANLLNRIDADMDAGECGAYLQRLLMYKGTLEASELLNGQSDEALEDVTLAYGLGNWHLVNGRQDEAYRVFEQIVDSSEWMAFGYIAAESDLRRLTLL